MESVSMFLSFTISLYFLSKSFLRFGLSVAQNEGSLSKCQKELKI